jgi:ribose 5-phosphate isomerase B
MRLVVGSDHAGFELKSAVIDHLRASGHEVTDLGPLDSAPVDYPDYGAAVGRAVVSGRADRGVAICGSGIGIAIAANKVAGVRAATVHDATSGRLCRQHNNANVVCLGQRLIGPQVALDALDAYLAAEFEGGRHQGRVDKISALEAAPVPVHAQPV